MYKGIYTCTGHVTTSKRKKLNDQQKQTVKMPLSMKRSPETRVTKQTSCIFLTVCRRKKKKKVKHKASAVKLKQPVSARKTKTKSLNSAYT